MYSWHVSVSTSLVEHIRRLCLVSCNYPLFSLLCLYQSVKGSLYNFSTRLKLQMFQCIVVENFKVKALASKLTVSKGGICLEVHLRFYVLNSNVLASE